MTALITPRPRQSALLLLALAVCLIGCGLELPGGYDELTFEPRPYLGDEIRTDGYWYHTYFTPQGDGPYHRVHFFFRNGVVRYGGAGPSLEDLEGSALIDRNPPRYYWGLFHVTGEQIAFERWYPGEYVSAFVRSGHILNDTTFVITESRRSRGGDVQGKEEVYRFRAFRPKPDSTSSFLP